MNCYPIWFLNHVAQHIRRATLRVGIHVHHARHAVSGLHWTVKVACVGGPLIGLAPLLPLPGLPTSGAVAPRPVPFIDRAMGGLGDAGTGWQRGSETLTPFGVTGIGQTLSQPRGSYRDLAYLDMALAHDAIGLIVLAPPDKFDLVTNPVIETQDNAVSEPSSLTIFGFGTLLTILIKKVRNFC